MQAYFLCRVNVCAGLCAFALVACGGGSSLTPEPDADTSQLNPGTPPPTTNPPSSSGTDAPNSTSATSTANVLCPVSENGTQNLVYFNSIPGGTSTSINENFAFNFNWTCSATQRTFSGNGVPNHVVVDGKFATKVSAQSISGTMSLTPAARTSATNVKLPGYAINSVKLDPGTAGTCTNTASAATAGCNYAGGSGAWRMEALGDPGVSPWKFDFGTDGSNAHVQPNGQYHYHGMPNGLIAKRNSASATSMTLVAWAADGFPIYANLGYSTAGDSSSSLKEMKGSYRVRSSVDATRPSTSNFPMGHFVQDWEYVAGSGDLDECNGRSGVTPEFPHGIYHYYITKTYPFIQRCVKGTAASWANMP